MIPKMGENRLVRIIMEVVGTLVVLRKMVNLGVSGAMEAEAVVVVIGGAERVLGLEVVEEEAVVDVLVMKMEKANTLEILDTGAVVEVVVLAGVVDLRTEEATKGKVGVVKTVSKEVTTVSVMVQNKIRRRRLTINFR